MVFTERIELSSTDYQSVALPLCYMNIKQRNVRKQCLFTHQNVSSYQEVTVFFTTAMVEDVGLEPLFHIPNVACYHYTTPSIYGISYWDSNPYLAVLETAVLPIKLRILVELVGLEPTIFCLQSNCAPVTLQSQMVGTDSFGLSTHRASTYCSTI